MEGFPSDMLNGFGKGDAPPPEKRPGQLPEEVDLSLGLSQGGRFGIDRTAPVVVVPEPPAGLQFYSPSAASLEGGGGTLTGSSSLPVLIEASSSEECKKRKEAPSLKGPEVIKKRNSQTCSAFKEAPWQNPTEMYARTDKLVILDEPIVRDNENHSSGNHLGKGLPLKYPATMITSQYSFSSLGKTTFKGTDVTEKQGSSSYIPSSFEAMSRAAAARRDDSILANAAPNANDRRDARRRLMQKLPRVYTKGKRVEGFLFFYKYWRVDDLRIICNCHESFHTAKEFVEHAGLVVDNPLRQIFVRTTP